MLVEWDVFQESTTEFDLAEDDSREWGSTEFIKVLSGGAATFPGPYESTPSWSEQVYETADKLMEHDFTVHSITELEVPNEAGGLTLTI